MFRVIGSKLLLPTLLLIAATTALADAGDDGYGSGGKEDEFKNVYALIDDEKFGEAYQELKRLEVADREADRLNLLGFTSRKSGNYVDAGEYYTQALALDPEHLGALEYQGELFITLGEIEKAQENLAKIDDICWFTCSEERKLKSAIEAALN